MVPLLLLALLAVCGNCDFVINSQVSVPFGEWEDWELCSPGSYVVSFDVTPKIIDNYVKAGVKDDLGLVGIVMQCSKPNSNEPDNFIYSKVTGVFQEVAGFPRSLNFTTAKNIDPIYYSLPLKSECEGVATGFQLMSEPHQISTDNTATTNIRLFCSGLAQNEPAYVEGYGSYVGEWEPTLQNCKVRQGICGLQTRSLAINDKGNTKYAIR